MKIVLLFIVTLISGAAFAGEPGDHYSDYVIESQLPLSACLAGDNSRCECPSIKERIQQLNLSISKIDSYVGNAVKRCLRRAASLTLGADGPATRDINGRAKNEQYCYQNEESLIAAAAEDYATKKSYIFEELGRFKGIEQAVCSN